MVVHARTFSTDKCRNGIERLPFYDNGRLLTNVHINVVEVYDIYFISEYECFVVNSNTKTTCMVLVDVHGVYK